MRILDTDVCVEILRGDPWVIETRRRVRDHLATTWITACELFHGAAKSELPVQRQRDVQLLLSTMSIIPPSAIAAEVFGTLKAALEREGQRLANFDLLIAACAMVHRATLVTGNIKHFGRIRGLQLEDWIRGSSEFVHEPMARYDVS